MARFLIGAGVAEIESGLRLWSAPSGPEEIWGVAKR